MLEAVIPLTISFAALFTFLMSHIIIWHYELIKRRGIPLIIIVAFLSYLIVMGLAVFYSGIRTIINIWVSGPLFMLFIMLYLHFYVGVTRSVSIRILGELVNSKSGRLHLREIQSMYPKEYMIKHRADMLVKNNCFFEKDGVYTCAKNGRRIGALEIFMKKLYSLELTG